MDSLDVEHLKKQLEEEHQQHEILMEHQRISYSSLQSQYDELYKRYQAKQEELNKRDKEAVLARYERGDGEEMKKLKEQMELWGRGRAMRCRERKEKERLNREVARLNADLSNMAERVHDAEQKQGFAEKEVATAKTHESELNERIQMLEVGMVSRGEM